MPAEPLTSGLEEQVALPVGMADINGSGSGGRTSQERQAICM